MGAVKICCESSCMLFPEKRFLNILIEDKFISPISYEEIYQMEKNLYKYWICKRMIFFNINYFWRE